MPQVRGFFARRTQRHIILKILYFSVYFYIDNRSETCYNIAIIHFSAN